MAPDLSLVLQAPFGLFSIGPVSVSESYVSAPFSSAVQLPKRLHPERCSRLENRKSGKLWASERPPNCEGLLAFGFWLSRYLL